MPDKAPERLYDHPAEPRPRPAKPQRDQQEKAARQLPEFQEVHEVDARDLSVEAVSSMLRARFGKGRRARVAPIHPELAAAFRLALSYGTVSDGGLVDVQRATA